MYLELLIQNIVIDSGVTPPPSSPSHSPPGHRDFCLKHKTDVTAAHVLHHLWGKIKMS